MVTGHIHINIPRIDEITIKRRDCPTCEKSRFMVVYFEEWYGATHTCLKCGEQWSGGEQRPRPFCRGWRKENIRTIKILYRRMKKILAK
jgi:ribosomal protein S27AE